MVESMAAVCRAGLAAYAATPRSAWVLQWPSQVVLAVTAIHWTQEVGEAMAGAPGGGALAAAARRCTAQLADVVELVRGELSALQRCAGRPRPEVPSGARCAVGTRATPACG